MMVVPFESFDLDFVYNVTMLYNDPNSIVYGQRIYNSVDWNGVHSTPAPV